jgi:hypothetical protein
VQLGHAKLEHPAVLDVSRKHLTAVANPWMRSTFPVRTA